MTLHVLHVLPLDLARGAQRYVNLASFRKSGREVLTPVWIVSEGERLYVYTNVTSGKVKRIRNGGRGACSVRYNRDGRLYTLVYDKVVAREVNPIEKKPLFHFYPGSYAYSISTVGCNLRCSYCQNWQISQWPKDHLPKKLEKGPEEDAPEPICPQLEALDARVPGETVTPAEIVRAARQTGCLSISYTFTEPTIFYELAYDTAVLAKEQRLKNSFVSNGFIGEAALREIGLLLDAVNIDLKFFREASYRRISRARLQPVLDAIRLYHELGVWLEVTTLVIPFRGTAGKANPHSYASNPTGFKNGYPSWRQTARPFCLARSVAAC